MNKAKLLFPALVLMQLMVWAQTANQPPSKAPAEKAPATPKSQGAKALPHSWKQVPVPALRPFHPQEPRRVELPNGMVIFLQEDHELPLVDGTIRIRGGS